MKNLLTGAWLFTVFAIVFYFVYRYAALPFTRFADANGGGEPIDPGGVYILAFFFAVLMLFLFFLLLVICYKIGEAVNQHKEG